MGCLTYIFEHIQLLQLPIYCSNNIIELIDDVYKERSEGKRNFNDVKSTLIFEGRSSTKKRKKNLSASYRPEIFFYAFELAVTDALFTRRSVPRPRSSEKYSLLFTDNRRRSVDRKTVADPSTPLSAMMMMIIIIIERRSPPINMRSN